MSAFLLAFLVGLGIVCSMAGWGWLTLRVFRFRQRTFLGYRAAVGLALSTSVGGLLNFLHAINPSLIRTYLVAGFILALVSVTLEASWIRLRAAEFRGYSTRHRTVWILGVVLLSLATFRYAVATSPGRFQHQDDYQGYFVFPLKMLETGSLGMDPFSERRIQSSLGGKAFLDTFTLATTGRTSNLHLIDLGVSFVVLLLLLAEVMVRRNASAFWIGMVLLAAELVAAPAVNITALYTAAVLIVVIFDMIADAREYRDRMARATVLAIVLAALVSLKTTFVPVAFLSWLGYALLTGARSEANRRTIWPQLYCGLLALTLLIPWMADSYRTSGTLFYPFLGRGFHGSRYGIYLLPTAQLGLRNVLAFAHGTQDFLFALLALEVGLLLTVRRWQDFKWRSSVAVASIVCISVALISLATGAYQVSRYTFPVVFAGVLFLLIEQLLPAHSAVATAAGAPASSPAISILLTGIFLGGALQGFTFVEDDRLADLQFALSGKQIDSPAEAAEYRAMQLAVPKGSTMLVFLDKHYLLDFRRNTIYINDTPGGASLPPGMPAFQGPDAVSNYLLSKGIRYLAYSYGSQANFTRAEFGKRLEPEVNVNLRVGAKMAFDFEDNLAQLGKTRKRIFDDGKNFVLDLATVTYGQSTDATSTAHS